MPRDAYRLNSAVPAVSRTTNILIAAPIIFPSPGDYVGCTLDLDIDSITGTSVTFSLVGFNEETQDWSILLSSAAQASAIGSVPLTISPYTPPTANVALCRALPSRLGLITSGTWNPAVFGGDLVYFK